MADPFASSAATAVAKSAHSFFSIVAKLAQEHPVFLFLIINMLLLWWWWWWLFCARVCIYLMRERVFSLSSESLYVCLREGGAGPVNDHAPNLGLIGLLHNTCSSSNFHSSRKYILSSPHCTAHFIFEHLR